MNLGSSNPAVSRKIYIFSAAQEIYTLPVHKAEEICYIHLYLESEEVTIFFPVVRAYYVEVEFDAHLRDDSYVVILPQPSQIGSWMIQEDHNNHEQ